MPAEAEGPTQLRALPLSFLAQLADQEELWVSSRDPHGSGRVRMWFAVSEDGYVYLFTHAFSKKAYRWAEDPWVRLRVPGGADLEAMVEPVRVAEVAPLEPLLILRFAMAGAATGEALREMLQSGSHQLLRVGLGPGLS